MIQNHTVVKALRRYLWTKCKEGYHLTERNWKTGRILEEQGEWGLWEYKIECVKCGQGSTETAWEVI